jgi:hypothetical protein
MTEEQKFSTMATSPASEAQAGWVMVPREPTFEMIAATANGRTTVADIYRAMLAAAPQPASSPVAAEGQKTVGDDVPLWKLIYGAIMSEDRKPVSIADFDRASMRVADMIERRFATPTASMADAAEAVAMGSVLQRVMARLADMLDDDQFNNIAAMVQNAGVEPPHLVSDSQRLMSRLVEAKRYVSDGPWLSELVRDKDQCSSNMQENEDRRRFLRELNEEIANLATPGPRGENAGGVVQALSRAEVEDVDAEVMKSPRDYCFQFATAIQRACATAWGLRIAEKGDDRG